jgi:hypothetical protein
MARQMRPAPSRAIASAGGLKRGERNVSMQCESASSPVAAVSPGGRPKRQLRIADRPLRDEVRADEAELPPVVEGDERGAADLGAGAGGGRDGDHRGDRRRDLRQAAEDRGIGLDRPGMGGKERHALGEVDRRAAAHRDDAVAAALGIDGERGDGGRLGGVRRDIKEDAGPPPGTWR